MAFLDNTYYYFKIDNGNPISIGTYPFKLNVSFSNYVEMTNEQKTFYLEHPNASVQEAWNCEINSQDDSEPISNIENETHYYFKLRHGHPYQIKIEPFRINTALMKMYLEFTQEQKEFYLEHPNASILEIQQCTLWQSPQNDIETSKQNKIAEINAYDVSENVNGFYLNNNLVWLDKETRVGLVNTLNSAEMVGRTEINMWFSGMYVTLPISQARQLLAVLEIYATDCYNVTEQHKVNVSNLTTIEAVDEYDFTTGYPDKPTFTL